ncbi:flagellar assembly protein FliW [Paenibacillus barengoltzii]|uniref:flagellar assembly protein FliW n=1 Tax=Paenibacillus barengoltzii TaxID=343517 RepID=UPI003F8AF751
MELETAQFGTVDVKEEQIFHFPKGIPGFEEHTRFAVIELSDAPFSYLQSLQEKEISLLLTDPFIFFPEYEFDLPESVVEEMKLGASFLIRCIVTLNKDITRSTINLLAPIVFNPENRNARQVILHSSEYQTRHLFWPGKGKDSSDKVGD